MNPDGRSIRDLVEAINTGSGGGFTVHPGAGVGISGVSAELAPVDGGYRLRVSADNGKTVDFLPPSILLRSPMFGRRRR